MSFAQQLDKTLDSFFSALSTKFKIPKTDIQLIWQEGNALDCCECHSHEEKEVSQENDITLERLLKANRTELIGLCKTKSLKCSGTKTEMIDRLKSLMKNEKGEEKEKTKPAEQVKKEKKPNANKKAFMTDLQRKLTETTVMIRKNGFGNFEHPETSLVFNQDKKAYGIQLDDGQVRSLTDEDIDLCKQHKFAFVLPDNLDTEEDKKEESVKKSIVEDEVLLDEEEVLEENDDGEGEEEEEVLLDEDEEVVID